MQTSFRFALGRIVAMPGAIHALTQTDLLTALRRHASGDRHDCAEEDHQ